MANVQNYLSEFHERRARRRRYVFFGMFFGSVVVVVLAALWALFWSQVLKFNRVALMNEGTAIEDASLLRAIEPLFRASALFPGDSFIGIRSAIPTSTLSAVLPGIKTAISRKRYREHLLTIEITERDPFGIWCFEKDPAAPSCVWFDEEGILFEPALNAEGSLLPVVRDVSRAPPPLGSRALSENFFANFRSALRVLSGSGLHIRSAALEDLELQEITVRTFEGPLVLFSLRFPAENAIGVIRSLREKSDFGALEYLDFRVENRAYYR